MNESTPYVSRYQPGPRPIDPAHYHPNHRHGEGHQQMSQAGYFDFDGTPAEREHYGEIPVMFNGAEWKKVDMGKFIHEATRIPPHKFEEMVALRKHQHEQHLASKK